MVSAPSGKYKIFIVDEVHMLTKDAFNALLKILEELNTTRLGIWSGLFYLVARDSHPDLTPIALLLVCTGTAALIEPSTRLFLMLLRIPLNNASKTHAYKSDVAMTPNEKSSNVPPKT